MKKIKIISSILVIIIIFGQFNFASASSMPSSAKIEDENSLHIGAEAAILIDYDTGRILYQKNIHEKLFPASTTKMMTAILALENGNLNDYVTIDQEIVDLTYGSHIALDLGEKLTLEQLLNGMLIASANDCALAIAKHVGGSIDNFVLMMNEKAKELGALDTNFVNPNGLHDENHVSSAYDLALIGRYAMQFEEFRKIVTKVTYEIPPTNVKTETRYLKLTNKLLFSSEKVEIDGQLIPIKYPYALGVKTGYTSHAKNCLVSYAEKDGQNLLAVVLKANGNEVYQDTIELLNYGFDNFDNVVIGYKDQFIDNIPIKDGSVPYVAGVVDKDIAFPISKLDAQNIERKTILNENLKAPISQGQIIGEIQYLLDGKLLGKANIISSAKVDISPYKKFPTNVIYNWYWFVFIFYIINSLHKKHQRKKKREKRKAMLDMSYGSK